MKRMILAGAGIALCFVVAAVGSSALDHGHRRGHGMNISDRDPVESCSDLRVSFGRGRYDSRYSARTEQSATLPVVAGRALAAEGSRHGGVYVIGGSKAEFTVEACLFAAGDSQGQAGALLRQIALKAAGTTATISGPEENDWVGFLIIRAPRASAVEVRTWNGPVSVREVAGKVQVEAENGPVSLHATTGQVRVNSENGPVSVVASQGDFVVRTRNGPLHVALSGTRWQTGSLEASTQNGPIHLEVPSDYQSGVLVDVSRHSPVECRAAQCRKAVRTWERPNRIEFGGSPVVKLSTVNGPVTVSETR